MNLVLLSSGVISGGLGCATSITGSTFVSSLESTFVVANSSISIDKLTDVKSSITS
jgi:hypothetical protein